MHDYQQLNMEALLDLLARETSGHTKAFIEGASDEELSRLRENVLSLQKEVNFRKEIYDGTGKPLPSVDHRKAAG